MSMKGVIFNFATWWQDNEGNCYWEYMNKSFLLSIFAPWPGEDDQPVVYHKESLPPSIKGVPYKTIYGIAAVKSSAKR